MGVLQSYLPGSPPPRRFEADDGPTGPVGLGGWLVFVTSSFVVGIPLVAYRLHKGWQLFFHRPATLVRMTTPGSKIYHPLWQDALIYEIAADAVRLLWVVVLAFLFFGRRRSFKPWMIAFQLTSVTFAWFDHYFVQQITPKVAEHTPRLIGYTIVALVWTQYFLTSRRVESTFTE